MHVLFLSTNQSKGGAAIAANRYFNAFRSVGGESAFAALNVEKPGNGYVKLKYSFPFRKLVKYLFKKEIHVSALSVPQDKTSEARNIVSELD